VNATASTHVAGRRITVDVHATSEKGTVTGYVYDFGDGSPLVTSTSATVSHSFAREADRAAVVVAVTDSLGHVGLEIAGGS
jgi:hypothetical protein